MPPAGASCKAAEGRLAASCANSPYSSRPTVSKALEEVFRQTLFGWESVELLYDSSARPYNRTASPVNDVKKSSKSGHKTTTSCFKARSTSSSPRRSLISELVDGEQEANLSDLYSALFAGQSR